MNTLKHTISIKEGLCSPSVIRSGTLFVASALLSREFEANFNSLDFELQF